MVEAQGLLEEQVVVHGYIGNDRLISNLEYTKHMTGYNVKTSENESTKTISTTNVSSTPTADYAKSGNGYARITFISYE